MTFFYLIFFFSVRRCVTKFEHEPDKFEAKIKKNWNCYVMGQNEWPETVEGILHQCASLK